MASRSSVSSPTSEHVVQSTARTSRIRLLPLLVAADLVVCAAVRLWYLASDKVDFIGDEAVTGIMVRRILHGKMFVFYAGQHYGGTLEQYLQAFGYLLFRLPQDAFTLRFTQVALSTLTCLLVYLCGTRVLGSPWRAAFAALLFALSPWFNIVGGTTSMGFYVVGQTLGIATVYAALRLGDLHGPARTRGILAFGILGGLGIWSTYTSAFCLILAMIWAVPILGRSRNAWLRWLTGFGVGAAPLVCWMAATRKLPLPTGPPPGSSVVQRLRNLVGPVFREFVGVSYRYDRGGLPHRAQMLVVTGLFVLFFMALWRRRHGVIAIVTLRTQGRRAADLLLVLPLIVVVLYPLSNLTWFVGTPRYLLTLYPLFAIGLVAALSRNRVLSAIGAVVIVALMASLSLGYFRWNQVPVTVRAQNRVMDQVLRVLVSKAETRVYAGYWTAMPLQYLAGSDVQVAVCGSPKRFADIQSSVESSPSPVYVVSPLDGSSKIVSDALRVHHLRYRTTQVGFMHIYDELGPDAQPWRIGLEPRAGAAEPRRDDPRAVNRSVAKPAYRTQPVRRGT